MTAHHCTHLGAKTASQQALTLSSTNDNTVACIRYTGLPPGFQGLPAIGGHAHPLSSASMVGSGCSAALSCASRVPPCTAAPSGLCTPARPGCAVKKLLVVSTAGFADTPPAGAPATIARLLPRCRRDTSRRNDAHCSSVGLASVSPASAAGCPTACGESGAGRCWESRSGGDTWSCCCSFCWRGAALLLSCEPA